MHRVPLQNEWNEFQWEAEIRKDELRISRYFTALAGCMDLPGEEDLIYRRLMSQPELVPTGVEPKSNDFRGIFNEFSDEEEEGAWEDGDMRRKPATEACRRVEYLASEWNILAASYVSMEHMHEALGVTCLFGRLLSRIYNLTEGEADAPMALRVSLLKRVLADINDLLGVLTKWQQRRSRIPNAKLEWFCDQLQHFREAAVDSLQTFRNAPPDKTPPMWE